jgi:hypothetical protein
VPLSASRALVYLFLSWSVGDMQDAQTGAFLLRLATAPQRSRESSDGLRIAMSAPAALTEGFILLRLG